MQEAIIHQTLRSRFNFVSLNRRQNVEGGPHAVCKVVPRHRPPCAPQERRE